MTPRAIAQQNLRDARDEIGLIANRLFGAKTMTKQTRHDLGRRLNGAKSKITTALLALGEEI